MGKRKRQSNSTSSNSRTEKVKTKTLTVNDNERKKLLNHIDFCKRNDRKTKIVRTFKYNATSIISRSSVKTLTKDFYKGLF